MYESLDESFMTSLIFLRWMQFLYIFGYLNSWLLDEWQGILDLRNLFEENLLYSLNSSVWNLNLVQLTKFVYWMNSKNNIYVIVQFCLATIKTKIQLFWKKSFFLIRFVHCLKSNYYCHWNKYDSIVFITIKLKICMFQVQFPLNETADFFQ